MKNVYKTITLTGLFVVLFSCSSCKSVSDQSQKSIAIQTSVNSWKEYIEDHIKTGDDVGKVTATMAGKAKDWGRIDLGGSGDYWLRFKLDDFIQAQFYIAHSGKLVSYGVYLKRELWIKDSEGNIWYAGRK